MLLGCSLPGRTTPHVVPVLLQVIQSLSSAQSNEKVADKNEAPMMADNRQHCRPHWPMASDRTCKKRYDILGALVFSAHHVGGCHYPRFHSRFVIGAVGGTIGTAGSATGVVGR